MQDLVFRVELLPVRHGDSILLTWGARQSLRHALIDGGPHTSYDTLRQRLLAMPPAQRRLELLVVSHIDNDHIGGIVRLLGDAELGLHIEEIWFNGWEQLSQPFNGFGQRPPDEGLRPGERSALEGHYLAHRTARRGLALNRSFRGQAICLAKGLEPPRIELEDGLSLTLLSPDIPNLKRLRETWDRTIAKARFDPLDPDAAARRLQADHRYRGPEKSAVSPGLVRELSLLAPVLDEAVANGSSIALLAEYEGRSCALLADAHMPVVEDAIRRIARARGAVRLRMDAVKLSHHGSKANLSDAFLRLIDCRRFLVSSDGGQFSHPDDEAISRVLNLGSKPVRLDFNYRSDRTRAWESADLQQTLGYAAGFPANDTDGAVVDLMAATTA